MWQDRKNEIDRKTKIFENKKKEKRKKELDWNLGNIMKMKKLYTENELKNVIRNYWKRGKKTT